MTHQLHPLRVTHIGPVAAPFRREAWLICDESGAEVRTPQKVPYAATAEEKAMIARLRREFAGYDVVSVPDPLGAPGWARFEARIESEIVAAAVSAVVGVKPRGVEKSGESNYGTI